MSSITDFAELGYDVDEALEVLIDLGIIESADDITDASEITLSELESLALMGNLVMLDAISGKSTEIEEELIDYEIEVGKLSAMQEALTLLYENADASGSTGQDLMDFIETEHTVIDEADTTLLIIDYALTYSTVDEQTEVSAAYETLSDFVAALESNELVDDGTGDTWSIVFIAYQALANELADIVDISIRDANGTELDTSSSDSEAFDLLMTGDANVYIPYTRSDRDSNVYEVQLTFDEFVDYYIAEALQAGGYIGENVYLNPAQFSASDGDTLAKFYTTWMQLYFGKISIETDSINETVSVAYNGTATLREAGIDLASYSNDDVILSHGEGHPLADEDDTWFHTMTFLYSAYIWDNLGDVFVSQAFSWISFKNAELDESFDEGAFKDSDIDLLLEAVATAIESQSTNTEVKLLSVNTSITEWGELNDVWDLIHEYIHDALKRASDNSL